MGFGGYAPTLMEGRYGEPDDEYKTEAWENQPKVGDLRGMPWGSGGQSGGSRSSPVPKALYPPPPAPAPPVLYPPPAPAPSSPSTAKPASSPSPSYQTPRGPPPGLADLQTPSSRPNPFDSSYPGTQQVEPSSSPQPSPQPFSVPTSTPASSEPRRVFNLSDPPVTVTHHALDPSDTTASLSMSAYQGQNQGPHSQQYSSSTYPDPYSHGHGHGQDPSYTTGHFTESSYGMSSDADGYGQHGYGGEVRQRGHHVAEPTDATFYTAAESREPSPDRDVKLT